MDKYTHKYWQDFMERYQLIQVDKQTNMSIKMSKTIVILLILCESLMHLYILSKTDIFNAVNR